MRQVAYALRTRPPVATYCIATALLPLDLHVLSLPLAFILSQDQTLHCIILLIPLSLTRSYYQSIPLSINQCMSATLASFLSKIYPPPKKLSPPPSSLTTTSSTLGLQKYSLFIFPPNITKQFDTHTIISTL